MCTTKVNKSLQRVAFNQHYGLPELSLFHPLMTRLTRSCVTKGSKLTSVLLFDRTYNMGKFCVTTAVFECKKLFNQGMEN
jgi:hypothetical protein